MAGAGANYKMVDDNSNSDDAKRTCGRCDGGGGADVWIRRAWWRKTHDIATSEIRMVDTHVESSKQNKEPVKQRNGLVEKRVAYDTSAPETDLVHVLSIELRGPDAAE